MHLFTSKKSTLEEENDGSQVETGKKKKKKFSAKKHGTHLDINPTSCAT